MVFPSLSNALVQNALSPLSATNAPSVTAVQAAIDVLTAALVGKQATLVSATNIKSVNGNSLLGSGDLVIAGGGGGGTWGSIAGTLSSQSDLQGALNAKSDIGHAHSTFTSGAAGYVPASGGGTTTFLRADGTFATPPGGGAALIVQEGDTTVAAAASTLDFAAADFDVTETPSGEANIAISTGIARILAPVTLSVNTALTAAAHGNRTLLVDTAGLTLTINNDATGGWLSDDALDIQAIGAGTFTLVQGTATLTTDSGTSASSTTAVGKRVQAQRNGASAWRTLSTVIVTPGGGSSNVTAYRVVGNVAAPLGAGESADLLTLNVGPLTADGDLVRLYLRATSSFVAAETPQIRFFVNSTNIHNGPTVEENAQSIFHYLTIERLTDTTLRITPNNITEYGSVQSSVVFNAGTVSSLSAGCTITVRLNRAAVQTKPVTFTRLSATVERA